MQWILLCHGLITLLVVISFLCGQWPIFQGTFIERFHHFLTSGAYDYFQRAVGALCGSKGSDFVYSVEYFCCDRPNPLLQIFYVAIIGGIYYMIASSCFVYIPGYYLTEAHRYISFAAVGVGILLFILTSFSDPGTVKPENVAQYLDAYPYDDVLYKQKECSTCRLDRSTAVYVTGVSPGLTTIVVGWHFLLCLYGTVAIGLILAGQLKELRIIHVLTVYYGIENTFRDLSPHVVQWLLASFNTQILVMIFLAIVSLLLSGFFSYHANLCLTNTTTNETFKWQEHLTWQKKLHEARASSAAMKASTNDLGSKEVKPLQESKCIAFFQRSRLENISARQNTYDKGFFRNLGEIMFPFSSRPSFSRTKSKAG
ncbi:Probable protein S-acyltransferase 17 [Linum grandiflorum]